MKKNVKITILKSEVNEALAKQLQFLILKLVLFISQGRFLSAMESISQMDCVNTHGSL